MGACTTKLDESTLQKNKIINGLVENPNYQHQKVFKTTINLKDSQTSTSKLKSSTERSQGKSLKSENKANPSSPIEDLQNFPDFHYFNRPTEQLFLITNSSTTEILLKSEFHFSQESAIGYLSSKCIIFIGGVFKSKVLNVVSLIDLSLQRSFLKAPLPIPCKQGQAHEYKNWVYYIGGICQSENGLVQSPLLRYSLQQDLWQDLGRYGEHYKFNKIINMGTCIMGNKLLLIGGQRITSSNSLSSNKKIFSINLENGFKVQAEGKMPHKLLKPTIASGKKHGIIAGGISLSTGTFNRKSYCIIIKNDICKIQTIESLSFDINELYPGVYCGNYVMFVSYPYIAVRMKNLKHWVEYQVTGKSSRLVMEICKDEVENYESESSEESEKIENASKKSIVGLQHHKSLGEMGIRKKKINFEDRKSVPLMVQKGSILEKKDKMELVISRIKSQTDEESKFSASPELFGDEKRVFTEGDEDGLNEMKRKEKNGFGGWPEIKMGGFEYGTRDEGNSFSEDFAGDIEVMMASDFIGSIEQDNPFLDDFHIAKTTDPQAIFSLMSLNFNLFEQSAESPILKIESPKNINTKTNTFDIVNTVKPKNDISDSEIIVNPEASKNDAKIEAPILYKQDIIVQEAKSDLRIPTNLMSQKDITKQVVNFASPIAESHESSSPKSKNSDKGYNIYSYKYEKNAPSSESSKSSNSDKNAYRFQNELDSLGSSKNSISISEKSKNDPEPLENDKTATNNKTKCQKARPKIPQPMFKFTSKNPETHIKDVNIEKQEKQEKPFFLCSSNELCEEIIIEMPEIQDKILEKVFSPKILEEEIVNKNDGKNVEECKYEKKPEGFIRLEEDHRKKIDEVLEIENTDESQKVPESSGKFFTPEISLKSKFSGKNKKKKSGSSSSSSESISSNLSKPRNKKKAKYDFSNKKTPSSAFIKADILPKKTYKTVTKNKDSTDFPKLCNNINTPSPYFLSPLPSATKSQKLFKNSGKNFQIISYSSIVLNKTPQESRSNSSSYQKILQDDIKITPPLDKNMKLKSNTFKNEAKIEENQINSIETDQNISEKYQSYSKGSVFPKTKSLGKITLKNFQPVVVSKHFQSSVNLLKVNENSPRKSLGHGQNKSAVINQRPDSKTPTENMCQDIDLISI